MQEWKKHLQNVNDLKRDTCQNEDSIKMTLIKVKMIKRGNYECESNTNERESE